MATPQPKDAAAAILERYDTNKDKKLSKEEIERIIVEYEKTREAIPPDVLAALRTYDEDGDGKLDAKEVEHIKHDVEASRYIAYAGMAARAARYLAFTSDVGEAFRPVVNPFIVRFSYGISWAYCIGDVAVEAHRAQQRGVAGTDLARLVSERAVFQAVASMAIPAFLIHSQVNVFKSITAKIGRFQRWGPTIAGLAVIPFLPVFLDEPAEQAVEWVFHKAWPVPGKH